MNVTAEDPSTRPVAIKSCGGDPIPANKKKYVRKTNANSADDEKLHQNILHAIEPEALSGYRDQVLPQEFCS